MTVMFCDLVDSTPLVGSLGAEDFREVVSGYQQACVRAIQRFDGHTARYVGDGVVAFFGYPRAHEDDAQRAVHAGLGILEELAVLNAKLRDIDISLQVRIGVHTGEVIAGEMGAGEARSAQEIVGEMPHIAARLESIAPPDTVVISDATRNLIEGYFETEPLGAKQLKGVSRPIRVHRVLRPTGAVGRLEVAGARRLTPLIGRNRELDRLADAWRQAVGGRGAVGHVVGEAGIGKSRLVHALLQRLDEQPGAVQVWQCSAHHRSTSLYPVRRFLERLLDGEDTKAAGHRLKMLDRAVVEAGLDPGAAVPLLADLLSVGEGTADLGQILTPRGVRTAMLHILEKLCVRNPGHHPLLLVVEDLHSADPTTIELLDRIVAGVPSIPVLCVLTFRREFEPPWAQRESHLEIEVEPLTPDQVRQMTKAASGTALDAALLDWVASAADGVPLFVEEILKTLDGGTRSDVAHPMSTTAVPPTLEGLLTERLDQLAAFSDVIDLAATLGREFDRSLLAALAPLDGAELEPALAHLADQDVLRPVGDAPSRWEFTHALLQEAAHKRILNRRRRALHGRVAEVVVSSFGELAEREPEVVAHHWSCAGEPAEALPFWYAAGSRAVERGAYLEAAEHFRRGLEALDELRRDPVDDAESLEFLTHYAASLQAGRGYAAAGVDDAYARARTACERSGNDDRLMSVIRGQWMFQLLRGEYGTALELADEMLTLSERGNRPVRQAEGHLYRGLVEMYLADFEPARQHLEQALARYHPPDRSDHIYEAQGDTGVGALAYLALVLWNLGHPRESSQRSELSLERAERVGGPVTRAQAWGMRSILQLSRGEAHDVAQWVEKTHAYSADHGIGYWRTVSSLLSAWVQGHAGDLAAATARLEEGLDAYLGSGSRLGLPHFRILLADLRVAGGDRPGALEVLHGAEEYMDETGERFSESELFSFKGRVLMGGDSPDPSGATAAHQRAVAAARRQNARLLELRAASYLAIHQSRIGETCTARERLVTLCDWFSATPELPDVQRARKLLASELIAG